MLGALKLTFALIAAVGLVLSLAVHLYTFIGTTPLPKEVFALHVGIFVVWFPAILVSWRLTREFKQKDWWRAALRGSPVWMRHLTYGCFAYALLNFALFIGRSSSLPQGPGGDPPPLIAHGFSGHWMAFYAAAMAVLYSSYRVGRLDPARRCPRGHPVPPSASYCETCGSPVSDSIVAPEGVQSLRLEP